MPILKLTGNTSTLSLHLEHPIHLDENINYRLSLVGFYSDNNMANLLIDAIIFFWSDIDRDSVRTLVIEKGYWTIETLENKCRSFIQSLNIVESSSFRITNDNAKVTIYSPLKFYLDETLRKLLGFDPNPEGSSSSNANSYCEAGKPIVAPNPPNLRAADVIEIHCNLVENSIVAHDTHWHKHAETSILYTFFPNVPHGYKISHTPTEKHYVPLRHGLHRIRNIDVTITDQDNNLVLNSDVNNIVYLDLSIQQ